MAGTIGPMVHGEPALVKCSLFALYAAAHGLSGAIAGSSIALIGTALILGPLKIQSQSIVLFSVFCIVLSLHEWRFIRLPLPQLERQVPKRWSRLSGYGMVFYEAVLGAGIGTRISTATYYALLLGVLLSGRVMNGTVAMAAFGLARAFPVCVLAALRLRDTDKYLSILMNGKEVMHLVNAVLLVTLGMLIWQS
jgi:hypothetical protein